MPLPSQPNGDADGAAAVGDPVSPLQPAPALGTGHGPGPGMEMSQGQEAPRELDAALSAILDTNDPLDSSSFNVVEYVNLLFPDAPSLQSLPTAMSRLKRQLHSVDAASRELVRAQTDAGEEAKAGLEGVRAGIQSLHTRLSHIVYQSNLSRTLVKEIAGDIAHLDRAKRNLAHAVGVLRRGQMMATAVSQLSHLVRKRQYAPCAQLLSAVLSLSKHFESYSKVPEFAKLRERVEDLQKQMRESVRAEFEAGFTHPGALRPIVQQVRDACHLVDAMEKGPDIRKQMLDLYCDSQLKEYRALFRGNDEIAALDNTSRRYAWLKRLLRVHDSEHVAAFPLSWRASESLCERFCDDTKTDLIGVLAKTGDRLDVKAMLGVLRETIEFEGWLARRAGEGGGARSRGRTDEGAGQSGGELCGDQGEGEGMGATPATVSPATATSVLTPGAPGGQPIPGSQFRRRISSAFEPYLIHYISAEDGNVSALIDGYRTKPLSEDDVAMGVLTSSTELFLYYRNALVHCAKMSTGKTMVDLAKMFGKWLGQYADILAGRLQKDEKKPLSSDDVRVSSIMVNTADYCYTTISQLEERLRDKVDPELQEQINLNTERETFLSVSASAIRALVRGMENAVEPGLSAMVKIPWASLDVVGDQNPYVMEMAKEIQERVGEIKQAIANGRYFRSFCDKFAESLLNKYANNIYRCKPISEVGAEQMLLDTHAIKSTLNQLPNMGSDAPTTPPSTYIKLVAKGVSKCETLLKIVMTPNEPLEGFLENYLLLSSQDSNLANFQRVLELKGIKRVDHQVLTDMFLRRTTPGGQSLPAGPLGTPVVGARTSSPAPGAGTAGFTLGGADFGGFKRLMGMRTDESPSVSVIAPSSGSASLSTTATATSTLAGTFAKLQTGWKTTTSATDDSRAAPSTTQPPPLPSQPAVEKPKVDFNSAFQKMWTTQK
ncbi:Vacuolar protein sorting-associated protein 53 [Gonapodya sp. JEL0774]|nr:Vacuolar protein sorting-associated protein 53 [Gonapodya sp. JEL0774]